MSHSYCIRRRQKGLHLTFEEREELEYVVTQNRRARKSERLTQSQMAQRMGVSKATISRELKRGRVILVDSELREFVSYSAMVAQDDYDYHATAKGAQLKIGANKALAERIEALIVDEGYSPYATVQRLREEGWSQDDSLHWRTLYHYIEKGVFERLEKCHLPRKGKTSKRRYTRIQRRIRDPHAKRIDDRPEQANDRSVFGHWEMDCMESGKGKSRACLLVLVERHTRKTLVFKMRAQTQKEVQSVLDRLEKKLGARRFREMFLSITVDNGSEFLDWRSLECSGASQRNIKRTAVYFCHPYHSWERGTNEQVNGHLRRFIPKGCDIAQFSQRQITEIARWLNAYPRKILGGRSANHLAPHDLLVFA